MPSPHISFPVNFFRLVLLLYQRDLVFGLAIFTDLSCSTYFNQNSWVAIWIQPVLSPKVSSNTVITEQIISPQITGVRQNKFSFPVFPLFLERKLLAWSRRSLSYPELQRDIMFSCQKAANKYLKHRFFNNEVSGDSRKTWATVPC